MGRPGVDSPPRPPLRCVRPPEGEQVDLGRPGVDLIIRLSAVVSQRVGGLGRQRGGVFHMGGKVGPVAQVAPAAHHRQVDAGAPALHPHRQHVDIAVARGQAALLHALLVQHAGQGADLVAHLGGAFEFQRVRIDHHLRLQRADHLVGGAQQEALGVAHIAAVVGR